MVALNTLIRFCMVLILGIVLPRCTDDVAGAGSETTNGIMGTILQPDGSPAHNTVVKLFPSSYDPLGGVGMQGIAIESTDRSGVFRFSHVGEGMYTVIARDEHSATSVMIDNISIPSGDVTATLPPGQLSPPGTITVDVANLENSVPGYLYIPGTDIYTMVHSSDTVALVNVPHGVIRTLLYAVEGDISRRVLRHNIQVRSEAAVTIDHVAWKYARTLIFNTSPTGAAIQNDVYDFPVLLRFNRNNFNFEEGPAAGNNLLFMRNGGNTSLPFEIERWDAAAGGAEVWVKIDTIFGNDADQSITMYWGNPNASNESSGKTVFDTGNGFQGVWHLGDNGDTIGDATANDYFGISPDNVRPSITDGIVGNARLFDDDYITMPNTAAGKLDFPQNGHYTLSAWVMTDTFDEVSHVIVSKGNMQYFLWLTPIHLNTTLWEFAGYRNGSGWDLSVQPAHTKQWVLLTGVRDGTSHILYVNGTQADSLIDFPFTTERNTLSDLIIGRFSDRMASFNVNEGFSPFHGRIDEVRICSKVRSPDWIKLCYMNQRNDDKLVLFK